MEWLGASERQLSMPRPWAWVLSFAELLLEQGFWVLRHHLSLLWVAAGRAEREVAAEANSVDAEVLAYMTSLNKLREAK
jgi:hypothetical protein